MTTFCALKSAVRSKRFETTNLFMSTVQVELASKLCEIRKQKRAQSDSSRNQDNTREESSQDQSKTSDTSPQSGAKSHPIIACGTCYNCYMEVKTNGIVDPKVCQLAQLAYSLDNDHRERESAKLQNYVTVSRLSAKGEKEARKKKKFSRVVTPKTEINLHCKACYDAGWRPSFGRSWGTTVFYFSIEEKQD